MRKLRALLHPSLPATALSLALAPALGAAQSPASVAIQVRGPGNQAVPSKISVRRDGVAQPTQIETDAQGNRSLPDMACDTRVEFKAVPKSLLYTGTGAWVACSSTPLVLAVKQNRVSYQAFNALSFNFPAAQAAQRDALRGALESGDSDTARNAAYALAVYLRQSGRTDLANDMTAVAFEQSLPAMAEAGVAAPDKAVRFDPAQKAYVATPDTLDALGRYQTKAGIRDANATKRPQLDFKTIQSFSSMAGKF